MTVACLGAAVHQFNVIYPLITDGLQSPAVVTEIHRGARTSKWAVYSYTTISGEPVTARDQVQLYLVRLHVGDQVNVLYSPEDPSRVTADLGLWTWQSPLIFTGGFVFLLLLGVLIYLKRGTPG